MPAFIFSLFILISFNSNSYAQGCAQAIAGAPALCAIGGQSLAAGAAVGAAGGALAKGAMGIDTGAAVLGGLTGAGAVANLTAAQACKAAMEKCRAECALEGSEPAMAECTAVYTPLIATLTTQATVMGVAAGASVGIGLLTKSKDSGGDGSSAANTAGTGGSQLNGTAGNIDGQSTITNSNNSQSAVPDDSDPIAALGNCTEPGSANLATCYDPLNDYCAEIPASALNNNPICQNFCSVKTSADSCTRPSGNQIIVSNGLPDPILPNSQNVGQPQVNVNSTPTSSANSSGHAVTASVTSSQHQGTCADPSQMHTAACFSAMKAYCGKYKNGTGCATFCSFYPNIKECRQNI